MEKVLGSHDVEGATVEVVVPSRTIAVGETVEIESTLTDTSGANNVDAVSMALQTWYRTIDGYQEVTIDRFTLAENLSIKSGLTRTQTTPITVPYETPCTIGSVDVRAVLEFTTGLDTVEHETYLEIEPTDRFETAFDATIDLGFVLRNVECLADRSADDRSYVQRFEFQPKSGPFRERLDQIDLFARTGEAEVTLFAAVDRTDGSDVVPADDAAKVVVRSSDYEQVRNKIQSFIKRIVSP